MRRTITIFILFALVLSGCGGPSQEQKDAAVKERAKARKLKSAAEDAAAVAVTCRDQVGSLLKALKDTESRLNVGMTFADYGDQVGDISVGYDQMPINQMSPDCISGPGVAGENAFNSYREAYNTWNDCIGDLGCDIDTIDPELQKKWTKASRQITRARSSLSDLETTAVIAQEDYEKQNKKAKAAEAELN
ncbi:MAG: hypothetical protein M9938_11215 [Solirubrobacterales bacterium]|nr:hypothetical protein [Solirubrobacterales bacterium]